MSLLKSMLPLRFFSEARAREVSIAARMSNLLFGSPNARRANGIVSTRFDFCGLLRRMARRLFDDAHSVPVYAIDRMGCPSNESLPRIWLSERVDNTKRDDGTRVFTECYPSMPDPHGIRALELGDRYFGEGKSLQGESSDQSIACFQAAEILYLHAARRGSRAAVSRLRSIYTNDLCSGTYWNTWLENRAKHARRRVHMKRITRTRLTIAC